MTNKESSVAKTTSKSKKSPKKKVVVNRAFLNSLADRIYNPETKQFLRLCNGTLQNGPDPTDESRPMHCGLGELYFVMTGRQPKEDDVDEEEVIRKAGRQPKEDDVDEEEVIRKAVNLSELDKDKKATIRKAIAGVKALKLPQDIEERALDHIDDESCDGGLFDEKIEQFRDALNDIPNANDDDKVMCGVDGESNRVFRARAKRVANALRRAAKILPR